MIAYVLINTRTGTAGKVVQALSGLEGVSVDATLGSYDAIARIEAKDRKAVGELVTKQIHRIDGVKHTITCFAIELG